MLQARRGKRVGKEEADMPLYMTQGGSGRSARTAPILIPQGLALGTAPVWTNTWGGSRPQPCVLEGQGFYALALSYLASTRGSPSGSSSRRPVDEGR